MGVHEIAHRAVFLDRDGIVNRSVVRNGKPYPPASAGELILTDGIAETLRALKQAGWLLVVVTNQPDVARGTVSRASVEEIHDVLRSRLPIDAIYACYHDSGDGCDCRKPRPGMIQAAARDLGIDIARSYMVGDRWRDVDAGNAAGCSTIFVDYGYDEPLKSKPNYTIDSPARMTEIILKKQEEKEVSHS